MIARNDIRTPQGTVIYRQGEVVGNLTTDENGYGELDNLNLGEYTLKESMVPDGFRDDGSTYDFTITNDKTAYGIRCDMGNKQLSYFYKCL